MNSFAKVKVRKDLIVYLLDSECAVMCGLNLQDVDHTVSLFESVGTCHIKELA